MTRKATSDVAHAFEARFNRIENFVVAAALAAQGLLREASEEEAGHLAWMLRAVQEDLQGLSEDVYTQVVSAAKK